MVSELHAAYFLALAEVREPDLRGRHELKLSESWERDHDNLRAALRWYLDGRDMIPFTRLAVAVWWFWLFREHWREGRAWLEYGLAVHTVLSPSLHAKLLLAAGAVSCAVSDFSQARMLLKESLTLSRELGDEMGIADALYILGFVGYGEGKYAQAAADCAESLFG